MKILDYLNGYINPLRNGYIGFSFQSKIKRADKNTPQALVGYKAIHLISTKKGVLFQSPSYSKKKYAYVAEAECQSFRHHLETIDPNCTCGFYSFKKPKKAWAYQGHNSVIAETVNSGAFIEYSEGYRAEIQRVRRVLVGDCSHVDHWIYGDSPKSAVGFLRTYNGRIEGGCFEHLRKHIGDIYSFDEVQNLFCVPDGTKHAKPLVEPSSGATPLTVDEIKKLRKSFRHIFLSGAVRHKNILYGSGIVMSSGFFVEVIMLISGH